jgi:NADPH:quinone reductase-like Zn-dependent oxidoreductase
VQAIVIRAHGGPEVLRRESLPDPVALPGEASVRVSHVGLNHLDVWVRRGVPGHDFHLPRVPGSDVAGTTGGQRVVLHPSWGCGECVACLAGKQNRCRRFAIRGESADGGACEAVCVPTWQLLPIPDAMPSAAAASLPLALLTAWHMLHDRARVRSGERVLVQAGASGVGVLAIQVARHAGCEVHATASTQEKRARLEALGARVWAYDAIGVRDVDVVVETVGIDTWASSLRALRWGGRLVCCGATSGAEVPLNLKALFFKQITLLGSTMGSSADMVDAWRAVTDGAIQPVLFAEAQLSKLGEAHSLLERRAVVGKVVCRQDLADA